ncbi:hypothetical protein [Arthrobacter pityocampae]|uniref:hypothetical protein n=1 Tax=Arthrobacter pityocampae TaxID=547334 RepID=UPI0011B08162|nr:hypothetical protein [Arthrobacter pityocampae]
MTSTVMQAGKPPASARLGVGARRLAVIAAIGSLTTSVLIGLFLGPLEAQSAQGLSELEQALLITCFIGLGSQVVWLGLGLWALIQGIVAVTDHRGRRHGRWAVWLAFTTPILSFGVFVGLTLLTSPLG